MYFILETTCIKKLLQGPQSIKDLLQLWLDCFGEILTGNMVLKQRHNGIEMKTNYVTCVRERMTCVEIPAAM